VDPGEEGAGERGQAGVGEGVEDQDGGDWALDAVFQGEPAGGLLHAAALLNLELERVQGEQNRLRERAEKGDAEDGGGQEQEQGAHGAVDLGWERLRRRRVRTKPSISSIARPGSGAIMASVPLV